MSDTKPDCYRCRYREDVPGSAHSSCHHPAVGDLSANPLIALVGVMGKRSGLTTLPHPAIRTLQIAATAHGVRQGWFLWPVNFDPVWLERCDGFTEKATATP